MNSLFIYLKSNLNEGFDTKKIRTCGSGSQSLLKKTALWKGQFSQIYIKTSDN
jgi:hypothetical protein